MKTITSLARTLGRTTLFEGYACDELAALTPFCDYRTLGPRETVFQQGQFCGAFFLVLSGAIKLTRRTNGGREQVLGFALPGDITGETGLFSRDGYTVTGITLEEAELLAIQSVPFLRFLQDNPALSQRMLAELTKRIDTCIDQIEQLTTRSADQKVAAFLLKNCSGRRRSSSLGEPVQRYRLRDLASLLSIRPETLCRIMGRFKKRDWVDNTKGRLAVKDERSLTDLLGQS